MLAPETSDASYASLLDPEKSHEREAGFLQQRRGAQAGLTFAFVATLLGVSAVATLRARIMPPSSSDSISQVTAVTPYTGTIVGKSPILKWQMSEHYKTKPLVEEGFAKVQYIKEHGVIDNFMAQHPEIKKIMWDEHFDGVQTIDMMMDYTKNHLVVKDDFETYMKNQGCSVSPKAPPKKTLLYSCGGEDVYIKESNTNWDHKQGPSNGFLRVFYHHIFSELKKFNSEYGWEDCQEAAVYDEKQGKLFLLNKFYNTAWGEDVSPIHWVIPQMHYIGVLPIDTAGDGQNFGLVKGGDVAVPVDLDRVHTSKFWSFIRLNTPEMIQYKVERNYLHIHN
jgi:hypothetical protein